MQIKEDELAPKETELEKQMRENWSPEDDKDMEQYAKTVANRDTEKERAIKNLSKGKLSIQNLN